MGMVDALNYFTLSLSLTSSDVHVDQFWSNTSYLEREKGILNMSVLFLQVVKRFFILWVSSSNRTMLSMYPKSVSTAPRRRSTFEWLNSLKSLQTDLMWGNNENQRLLNKYFIEEWDSLLVRTHDLITGWTHKLQAQDELIKTTASTPDRKNITSINLLHRSDRHPVPLATIVSLPKCLDSTSYNFLLIIRKYLEVTH